MANDAMKSALIERAKREKQSRGGQGQAPADMFLNPETGQMTSREMLQGNADTSLPKAAASGYVSGYSMNTADEMAGGAGYAEGGPDMANFRREQARAQHDALKEAHPVASTIGEVTGAITSPVGMIGKGIKTVRGAAALAGGTAAADAYGRGEGDAASRATDAAVAAPTGALLGAASAATVKYGTKAFRSLFQQSAKRPSVGNLRATKQAAYKAVDQSNERFSPDDMKTLTDEVAAQLADSNYVEGVDTQTDAMLKLLQRQQGREMTLGRLDKLRQDLWKRYSRADNEVGLLDGISAIDDLIEQKAGSSELMKAARLANSRYKKSEMLEDAFNKARLQTSGSGSGGNILNKYRQAVTAIVTNPKKAKWFDKNELALMENFIEGSNAENTLRRVGKLAPGGNGLMTALNVYAATVDPAMLAVTGVASLAKGTADRTARQGSENLLDSVSTGVIRQPKPTPSVGRLAVGSGASANALRDF